MVYARRISHSVDPDGGDEDIYCQTRRRADAGSQYDNGTTLPFADGLPAMAPLGQ